MISILIVTAVSIIIIIIIERERENVIKDGTQEYQDKIS